MSDLLPIVKALEQMLSSVKDLQTSVASLPPPAHSKPAKFPKPSKHFFRKRRARISRKPKHTVVLLASQAQFMSLDDIIAEGAPIVHESEVENIQTD